MSRSTQTIFGMAGVVLPFAGAVAPNGWLLCQGQAVSRTTYAHLFAVLGTTYGAGDGSTTFNVPDLRDEFIRGTSATRALGAKEQATKIPTVYLEANNIKAPYTGGNFYPEHDDGYENSNTQTKPIALNGSGASGNYHTHFKVRPRNIALNHIIKT